MSALKLIEQHLLEPATLNPHQLADILAQAMPQQADFADLYLQDTQSEHWFWEEGKLKNAHYDNSTGFGLRVQQGEKTGFAFSDVLNSNSLISAAQTAKSIIDSGQQRRIDIQTTQTPTALYSEQNPLTSLNDPDKVELLAYADHFAKSLDPAVKQVFVSLNSQYEQVWLLNSNGLITGDIRPMIHFHIQVIAEKNGKRESASTGGGGRFSYEQLNHAQIETHARKAVRQALLLLEAKPTPAGTMPVVLGPGWPAVLLHEAVGHGLEADFNRKGSSVFSGKIGEKVAHENVTIVDQGNIQNRRGSLSIDDEGNPTQETVLIENGILKNYMSDELNARLMKTQSTGNGRRESYAHAPLPRMTNTFMKNGQHDPQEIIKSVKKGIYAVDFAGGQVDITSGSFVFSMSEAYMIEDGKVTYPIKGATLIGNGPKAIQKISMVGNDLALDPGIGNCGKAGQSVPVGVGQPTLKVDELVVGG